MTSARFLIALILAGFLLSGCTDEMGNRLSGFSKEESSESESSILTGHAYLQGENDHSYIRVDLSVAGFSMLTDTEGEFTLPKDLSEGDWTVVAKYPYFHNASQTFSVSRGVPEKRLKDMTLEQAVNYTVTTNGTFFTRGSTVIMTVAAENISTETVTLSSTTSPMAAFSIRKGSVQIAGGLFPGDDPTPEEVALDPGDTKYFELRWKIDDTSISPGTYDLYAVLTSNGSHPEYFDPSDDAAGFNQSLYDKLRPTKITIE